LGLLLKALASVIEIKNNMGLNFEGFLSKSLVIKWKNFLALHHLQRLAERIHFLK
jgi:hypothetical protein